MANLDLTAQYNFLSMDELYVLLSNKVGELSKAADGQQQELFMETKNHVLAIRNLIVEKSIEMRTGHHVG